MNAGRPVHDDVGFALGRQGEQQRAGGYDVGLGLGTQRSACGMEGQRVTNDKVPSPMDIARSASQDRVNMGRAAAEVGEAKTEMNSLVMVFAMWKWQENLNP